MCGCTLTRSLDDIIKGSGSQGSGGKVRGKQQKSGGRDGGRDGGRQKAKSTPYSRPDTSDKDKKGRGNFQYGKESTRSGGGGGGGGGGMRGGRDSARGGGGGGGGGGDANTVFVGGLSENVDWKALKEHMAQVTSCATLCPPDQREAWHSSFEHPALHAGRRGGPSRRR